MLAEMTSSTSGLIAIFKDLPEYDIDGTGPELIVGPGESSGCSVSLQQCNRVCTKADTAGIMLQRIVSLCDLTRKPSLPVFPSGIVRPKHRGHLIVLI